MHKELSLFRGYSFWENVLIKMLAIFTRLVHFPNTIELVLFFDVKVRKGLDMAKSQYN